MKKSDFNKLGYDINNFKIVKRLISCPDIVFTNEVRPLLKELGLHIPNTDFIPEKSINFYKLSKILKNTQKNLLIKILFDSMNIKVTREGDSISFTASEPEVLLSLIDMLGKEPPHKRKNKVNKVEKTRTVVQSESSLSEVEEKEVEEVNTTSDLDFSRDRSEVVEK